MPQASDKDREEYRKRFGDIGAEHAVEALKKQGYSLRPEWLWQHPEMSFGDATKEPTEDDWFLIGFLVDEWDFGSLWVTSQTREEWQNSK